MGLRPESLREDVRTVEPTEVVFPKAILLRLVRPWTLTGKILPMMQFILDDWLPYAREALGLEEDQPRRPGVSRDGWKPDFVSQAEPATP
jgi:hypothetical protein